MLAKRLLLAIAILMIPALGHALEPKRRDVIVVSGRVWDGFAYRETFLPSDRPELRLLDGKDSAITFVGTEEYYWPLSRQVYVDFERRRDVIDGALEIRRDGEVVATLERNVYAIIYPDGAVNGNATLVWGAEAVKAFEDYKAGERDFARRFVDAQRAHAAYERALLESGAARLKGETVPVIAPPPPLPQPSLRLVTQPVSGYQIDLAPGDYTLRLVAGGALVPGTERRLKIVAAEGRRSVVADVVPEERWTRPIASNAPSAKIYARPGSVFYATLAEADRYDEADYLPVITPQSDPVDGRTMWVRRKPSDLSRLTLRWTGAEAAAVRRGRLKVEQTDGSGFGYKVRAARDGEKEDLTAFAVSVPVDPSVTRGRLSDDEATGFAREIVVVQPRNGSLGLIAALLPMLAWAGIRLRRSSRGRR